MKNTPFFTAFTGAFVAALTLSIAGAQPSAQTTSPPPAAPPPAALPFAPLVATMPSLPIVDPANELKGAALIGALRKGGFVLYMRHSETGTVTEKCDASNLSAIGEQNARSVGAALRELKIPVGVVRSSQPCRCADTARLLGLGNVEITEDLNPSAPRPGFDIGAARSKRLNEAPTAGTNTILVSHLHGSRKKEEWLHLEMGEIIVFKPEGDSPAVPVARVRVAEWIALKGLDKTVP